MERVIHICKKEVDGTDEWWLVDTLTGAPTPPEAVGQASFIGSKSTRAITMAVRPDALQTVISDGHIREYVGIGWIYVGKAKPEDYLKYPVVIQEKD